ncbi:MAG: hypothetical protein HFG27_09980 [Provencibacterium sp.]|jgi:hypothetical protein|nr:hypothetical protein [Provencibacterium sp.]
MTSNECCTIFNRRVEGEERREVFEPTVLSGICWQGGGAMRDRKQPTDGNLEIFIPFSAHSSRRYAPPRAYAAAPAECWTLREGDLICRGAFSSPVASVRALLESGCEAAIIMSVSENDFGSEALRHWEVCAR